MLLDKSILVHTNSIDIHCNLWHNKIISVAN